jgi:hypothetical protein
MKQDKTTKKKITFLCDICGKESTGEKFSVLDENWNKQKGLSQCKKCECG